MRTRAQKSRQADKLQQLRCAIACRLVVALEHFHREQHVVEHTAPRHQARALEDEAVIAERFGDFPAADRHRARRLLNEAGNDAQQRGLAAAARATAAR